MAVRIDCAWVVRMRTLFSSLSHTLPVRGVCQYYAIEGSNGKPSLLRAVEGVWSVYLMQLASRSSVISIITRAAMSLRAHISVRVFWAAL